MLLKLLLSSPGPTVMGQRACPFGAIKTSGIYLESTRNCTYWTPAKDRLQITNRGDGSKESQQRRTSVWGQWSEKEAALSH